MLNKLGVAPAKQKNIIVQQQSNNYQLACVEHFKAMHDNVPTSVYANDFGNHPNAWFTSSVNAAKKDEEKKGDAKLLAGKAQSGGDVEMSDPVSISPEKA